MLAFARIAVFVPEVRGFFDYSIPSDLADQVLPGSLVEVPFGKQQVQGVVISLPEQPDVIDIKPILALVDNTPVLPENLLKLALFLSEKYLQPISAYIALMLPPGIHQQADTLFHLNLPKNFNSSSLPEISKRLVALLSAHGSQRGRQLDRKFRNVDWRKSARALVKKGLLVRQPILPKSTVKKKFLQTVSISDHKFDLEAFIAEKLHRNTKTSLRRAEVLRLLSNEKNPVASSWIYASCGANSSDLKWLEKEGAIRFHPKEIWRDPVQNSQPDRSFSKAPILTSDQGKCWKKIKALINERSFSKPVLLHGITGSGKTELYMRVIEKVIASGKQAIVLVPEISLTPQAIERFMGRFPGSVGLIHSKLSPGERFDTWRRARNGDFSIVIGPRSALFTPFPNLGAIILDEFHDESYYQTEMGAFFSTADAAIELGKQVQAFVLLGSATPDVSLYFRAKYEKWPHLELPSRVASGNNFSVPANIALSPQLPKVEIVDMRAELKEGNVSIFSRRLIDEITKALERKQQAILFLNRRGSASYVFCRDCGYSLKCPRCNFALTFHKRTESLNCHTCGYSRQMPGKCPQCESKRIKQFGTGTEKVESDLQNLFPSARLLRWDADTSSGKGAEEIILTHFRHHNADILIGTQMLAKGLDLPLVTLVGVILADIGLNFPDYRTAERTFQILTQVVGRAGRSALDGKAILQTFQPENYAIQKAANHDFSGFYQQELKYRRELRYPPFVRMVRFEIRDPNSEKSHQRAVELFGSLERLVNASNDKSLELNRPTPPYFGKRNGQYRWQIILKGSDPLKLIRYENFYDIRIEVDPPTLL